MKPEIAQHLSRLPVGYVYWTTVRHAHGNRHVGAELCCVMDDFGTLVPVGGGH